MTVNVTVTLTDATGDALASARVSAKLFFPESLTDFIAPESIEVTGTTNVSGQAVLALWPNSSNTTVSTYYRVRAWHPTTKEKILDTCAYVDTAANLEDISYACGNATTTSSEWSALASHLANLNAHRLNPYIAGAFLTTMVASDVIAYLAVPAAFSIPAGAAGSYAITSIAATAQTVLSMKKNGVEFGTITYAAGSTSGSVSVATATSFAAGDSFSVVAPASEDSTLAKGGFTIAGSWI